MKQKFFRIPVANPEDMDGIGQTRADKYGDAFIECLQTLIAGEKSPLAPLLQRGGLEGGMSQPPPLQKGE